MHVHEAPPPPPPPNPYPSAVSVCAKVCLVVAASRAEVAASVHSGTLAAGLAAGLGIWEGRIGPIDVDGGCEFAFGSSCERYDFSDSNTLLEDSGEQLFSASASYVGGVSMSCGEEEHAALDPSCPSYTLRPRAHENTTVISVSLLCVDGADLVSMRAACDALGSAEGVQGVASRQALCNGCVQVAELSNDVSRHVGLNMTYAAFNASTGAAVYTETAVLWIIFGVVPALLFPLGACALLLARPLLRLRTAAVLRMVQNVMQEIEHAELLSSLQAKRRFAKTDTLLRSLRLLRLTSRATVCISMCALPWLVPVLALASAWGPSRAWLSLDASGRVTGVSVELLTSRLHRHQMRVRYLLPLGWANLLFALVPLAYTGVTGEVMSRVPAQAIVLYTIFVDTRSPDVLLDLVTAVSLVQGTMLTALMLLLHLLDFQLATVPIQGVSHALRGASQGFLFTAPLLGSTVYFLLNSPTGTRAEGDAAALPAAGVVVAGVLMVVGVAGFAWLESSNLMRTRIACKQQLHNDIRKGSNKSRASGMDSDESSKYLVTHPLTAGSAAESAQGEYALFHLLRVDADLIHDKMREGIPAIVEEISQHGTNVDRECLHYVLNEKAGSSHKTFQHGWMRDMGRNGELLIDFLEHQSSQTAGLSIAHVLALRLYTTACFHSLNSPMRHLEHDPVTGEQRSPAIMQYPHPLPVTLTFIFEGIKRLRAVNTKSESPQKGPREGKVVELLEDGRVRVHFDSGDEHRYWPDSLHKMEIKHVAAPQDRALVKQKSKLWKTAENVYKEQAAVDSIVDRVRARANRVVRESTRRFSSPSSTKRTASVELYRGIKNVKLPLQSHTLSDSFVHQHGGTEYSPMSASNDMRVALEYTRPARGSRCESVLLLRLRPSSAMDQGVSLEYLSCFPQEQEFLFPPLTFMRISGAIRRFKHEQTRYEIVDVTPTFPG